MKSTKLKAGRHEHVFAIVRVDDFHSADVAVEQRVTITKIVHDQDTAEQEVKRLNDLGSEKRVHYFSQVTRLEKQNPPAPTDIFKLGPISIVKYLLPSEPSRQTSKPNVVSKNWTFRNDMVEDLVAPAVPVAG